jgi:hypothetical protein
MVLNILIIITRARTTFSDHELLARQFGIEVMEGCDVPNFYVTRVTPEFVYMLFCSGQN